MRRLKDFGLNIAVALVSLAAVTMVSIRVYERFVQHAASKPNTRTILEWREYAAIGSRIGPADAPVTIVEFSDFQCPVCKLAWESLKNIRKHYPNEVAVVFRHFPLSMHTFAAAAAHSAQCAAEQGAFEAYQDTLFSSQELIGRRPWVEFAREAGILDVKRFEVCTRNSATLALVDRDALAGKRLGVSGTPRFLINDLEVMGYPGSDRLEALVASALQAAQTRPRS